METQLLATKSSTAGVPEQPVGLRYVARQPILDRRNRVHGYELLFREGNETSFNGDVDMATRTMLDNTVLFGLETLTCGLPAFVNCTREALTEDLVHVLPPGMAVLEILETLELTPELIQACRRLKAAGFRLALDDFTWRPGIEPLVKIADYIKVDFRLTNKEERVHLRKRLNGQTVALVAEKVETQEEYQQACKEGFQLFQGFYFCRPVLLKNGKVPANRLLHIEILQRMRNDPLELRKLTQLVKQDASLTYRLLRLVNSPICAVRQEIRSIQSALVIVGDDAFRRMATLAIASEFNAGQPAEILRMSFVRARFCELTAKLCGLEPTEQFLLGMLSLLPAMLRQPMEELTPQLPLRQEILEALCGARLPWGMLLQWLESYEQGDWAGCDAVAQSKGLSEQVLAKCYADALVWAETALHLTA